MKHPIRYALLFGAALVVGGGVAVAQMSSFTGDLPSASSRYSSDIGVNYNRGRLAERFLAEFDLNKDGKVTHDELNRTLAQQFMSVTGKSSTMTEDQFVNAHLKDLRGRATQMFHRMDWHGTGKLSLDDFAAPERARFEAMDRDGTGVVQCSTRSYSQDSATPENGRNQNAAQPGHRRGHSGSSGGRGRGSFCREADLNNDGQVTRAELDKYVAQEFGGATKGAKEMTFDQFYAYEEARSRDIYAHVFERLNTSHTGKLTLQEYAAPDEKLFARLDKNNTGVVTADEMMSSRRSRYASNQASGR